jgi:uncharacterized protein YgfB (UPF0149 family)
MSQSKFVNLGKVLSSIDRATGEQAHDKKNRAKFSMKISDKEGSLLFKDKDGQFHKVDYINFVALSDEDIKGMKESKYEVVQKMADIAQLDSFIVLK